MSVQFWLGAHDSEILGKQTHDFFRGFAYGARVDGALVHAHYWHHILERGGEECLVCGVEFRERVCSFFYRNAVFVRELYDRIARDAVEDIVFRGDEHVVFHDEKVARRVNAADCRAAREDALCIRPAVRKAVLFKQVTNSPFDFLIAKRERDAEKFCGFPEAGDMVLPLR